MPLARAKQMFAAELEIGTNFYDDARPLKTDSQEQFPLGLSGSRRKTLEFVQEFRSLGSAPAIQLQLRG